MNKHNSILRCWSVCAVVGILLATLCSPVYGQQRPTGTSRIQGGIPPVPVPRASIQYGDSKCFSSRLGVNNSLPNLGSHLILEVYDFGRPFFGNAAVWMGTSRVDIPWKVSTGQTCHFLAYPQVVWTIPMIYGYGAAWVFQIPKSTALIGVRLYTQMAIRDGSFEVWSPGTEMIIQ